MTGEELRRLREARYLTVRELAEKSGVSTDAITKIENGYRPGRRTTHHKLLRALEDDGCTELLEAAKGLWDWRFMIVPYPGESFGPNRPNQMDVALFKLKEAIDKVEANR